MTTKKTSKKTATKKTPTKPRAKKLPVAASPPDIYARQGDVVIRQQVITGELTPATDLIVAGASSHPHTIRGTCLHRRDGRATLVRIEKSTTIDHAGRHKPIPMPAGDYHLSPLRERGDRSDRAVED